MADETKEKKKRGHLPTCWKPGQSGNPHGHAKIPQDIKDARKLNRIELERVINKYLHFDAMELSEIVKNPKGVPMIEMVVASILWQAAAKGDHLRLDFILERLIGKVPIKVTDVTEAKEKLPTPQEALAELLRDPANQPPVNVEIKDLDGN